jgi:hypothetical protein
VHQPELVEAGQFVVGDVGVGHAVEANSLKPLTSLAAQLCADVERDIACAITFCANASPRVLWRMWPV